MDYEIIPLFSTPLCIFKNVLDIDQYQKIDTLVKNCDYGLFSGPKKHNVKPQPKLSKNLNILDEVPEVKIIFEEIFTKYMYDLKRVINTKFIINCSWVVKINPGQDGGNYHIHANSYFSGVMYLENNISSIEFKSPLGANRYSFDEEENTPYNTTGFLVNPEKNMLLFFPSHIEHKVNTNLTNNIRYSIAFNIIPSGSYGYGTSSVFS